MQAKTLPARTPPLGILKAAQSAILRALRTTALLPCLYLLLPVAKAEDGTSSHVLHLVNSTEASLEALPFLFEVRHNGVAYAMDQLTGQTSAGDRHLLQTEYCRPGFKRCEFETVQFVTQA